MNRPKLGGEIGFLGLEDFWFDCSPEEQFELTNITRQFLGASPDASPIAGSVLSSATKLSFLSSYISWTALKKDYALSEKIICWAERYYDEEKDPIVKHYYLLNVSEYYYKLRDTRENALVMSRCYYERDVEIFDQCVPIYKEELNGMPHVPSFKRLAIIYEKAELYDEAINICRKAVSLGIPDNTKGGYSGRIGKLQKKRDANTKSKGDLL